MKKFLTPFFRILVIWAIVLSFPHFAMALVMDNYLLFGGGAVTLDSTSIINGKVYAGGAIDVTGATFTHADYVGGISGTPASGTTLHISSLGALDLNSVILTDIGGLGYTYTTISNAYTFTSSDLAGIYHVEGAVTFAPGATGNWTIISDGAFTGTGGVDITSFIAATSPSGAFPNGLALYGAGALNLTGTGNDIFGAVAVAGAVLHEEGNINSLSSQVPVPEPTTMLLLGSGLVGLAGYGRKKFFKK